MTNKIICIVSIFVLSCALFLSHSAYSSNVEKLAPLIEEALKNNPRIQSTHDEWKAEEYKIPQARSLPDPQFRYGHFGESIQTRTGPQESKIGVSLKVPFPSKLVSKNRSQTKSALIFKEGYEATKREIIKDLKTTYYDIFWIDMAIQVTSQEKAILENLERVANKKYETNIAPQQDVIKAQVEITKLIDKLSTLKENRKSLVSRMNSILDRPRDMRFGRTAHIKTERLKMSLEELKGLAFKFRQELRGAGLAVEKARHETSLANQSYIPDFTFGFDYTTIGGGTTALANDGRNAWMGSVGINVPLWIGKNNAKIREKKSRLSASRRSYEDVKNAVSYQVEDMYFRIRSYRDTTHLYRTALIPQTEQAFDAAKIGYESGKVDFLNWLDEERTLLQTRLAYYRSIVDKQKAVAQLERVVGTDLEKPYGDYYAE